MSYKPRGGSGYGNTRRGSAGKGHYGSGRERPDWQHPSDTFAKANFPKRKEFPDDPDWDPSQSRKAEKLYNDIHLQNFNETVAYMVAVPEDVREKILKQLSADYRMTVEMMMLQYATKHKLSQNFIDDLEIERGALEANLALQDAITKVDYIID